MLSLKMHIVQVHIYMGVAIEIMGCENNARTFEQGQWFVVERDFLLSEARGALSRRPLEEGGGFPDGVGIGDT